MQSECAGCISKSTAAGVVVHGQCTWFEFYTSVQWSCREHPVLDSDCWCKMCKVPLQSLTNYIGCTC